MHIRQKAFLISMSALALAPLALFAWSGPASGAACTDPPCPPGGNVAAPINVGTTDQVKNGGLGVTSLAVFGNSLFGGSTGSNAYLNFGATGGTNGYGIRDNAGLLEFKNSGGSWASLQSTIFTLVGSWTTSGNNIYNTNTGNVGIKKSSPVTPLDVGGTIKIGNTGEMCQAVTEGAVRYNSSTKVLEYCNGSSWNPARGESYASAIGLDPAVWPDYIICVGGDGTYRYFQLFGANGPNGVGYHHTDAGLYIWFYQSNGSYALASNATVAGDCVGKSIQQLRAIGRAKYFN